MSGQLTTHVLDTTQGCPAAHMTIQLWRLTLDAERTLLKTVQTMPNGRTETPLLMAEELTVGTYELHFAVAAYFSAQSAVTATPPFLDIVPVRFSIADATVHYHVPLLVSPWAYSIYRGS